jgi:hypothetical protein
VTPHDEMIATWKKDPAFRKEYDALAEEFALFDALVSARQQAGLTQMEVAERMGTKTPAVARLEAGGGASAPCALPSDITEVCRCSGVPFGGQTYSPLHRSSARAKEG